MRNLILDLQPLLLERAQCIIRYADGIVGFCFNDFGIFFAVLDKQLIQMRVFAAKLADGLFSEPQVL